jgi:hypothetical protein
MTSKPASLKPTARRALAGLFSAAALCNRMRYCIAGFAVTRFGDPPTQPLRRTSQLDSPPSLRRMPRLGRALCAFWALSQAGTWLHALFSLIATPRSLRNPLGYCLGVGWPGVASRQAQ